MTSSLENEMGPRVARAALLLGGVLALATILVPSWVWSAPAIDGVYTGFDEVLMAADPRGLGDADGSVVMEDDQLVMLAPPSSQPTVHLTTGPLSSVTDFTFIVVEPGEVGDALRLDVWSPFEALAFRLRAEAGTERQLIVEQVEQGRVIDSRSIGTYAPGQRYSVIVALDRNEEAASIALVADQDPLLPTQGLSLKTLSEPFESHVLSDSFPVAGGETYAVEARVQPVVDGQMGMSVEWLDADGDRLEVTSDWVRLPADSEWRQRGFPAAAPGDAVRARIAVAVAGGAQGFFADVQMTQLGSDAVNLLRNGDFSDGAAGWRRAEGAEPLEVLEFPQPGAVSGIDAEQWPELFSTTRMAVTASSDSAAGTSKVRLSDLRVTLPHERWLAVRVEDPALRWLMAAVLVVVVLSGGFLIARWARDRSRASWSTLRATVGQPLTIRRPAWALALLGSIVGFLVGNAALARVSSSNVDLVSARVWTYVTATRGLDDLYFLPNLSSAPAPQWLGIPLQEAGFPYGPTMALIEQFKAWIYLAFASPADGSADVYALDTITHGTNAVFAVVCGVLMYFLLRLIMADRSAVIPWVAAFLFTPTMWIAGSIWGSSQAVSLAFLLAALLFALRDDYSWSWGFLLAASMTRPQNLVPGLFVAIFLLRHVDWRASLRSLAIALAATFVVFFPLLWAVAPSLPVDALINALFLHVGGGNDAWTLPLSWGAPTLWPLVAPLRYDVSGIERILFPATEASGLGLSYYQLGNALMAFTIVALIVSLLMRRDRDEARRVLPLTMLAGAMALLFLRTGTPVYHVALVVALAFVSAGALPKWAYRYVVIALTTTTSVSMYLMGAFWLSRHPEWSIGVYDADSPVVRFAADLAANDVFITIAAGANISAMAIVLLYVVRPQVRDVHPPDTLAKPPVQRSSELLFDSPRLKVADVAHDQVAGPIRES